MSVSDLSLDQVSGGLGRKIDEIATKIQQVITDYNVVDANFTLLDNAIENLAVPITITIDTITSYATALSKTNEALETLRGQFSTIIGVFKMYKTP